jgi:phosphatidylserine/phosphatidylglycerophosphate/cardiolipin synthase-like enzyme
MQSTWFVIVALVAIGVQLYLVFLALFEPGLPYSISERRAARIADQWWKNRKRQKRWRDTMFRVEGPAVSKLQAMFTENWLIAAIRKRGVEVIVLLPGQHTDHLLTRRSSRRIYGELLKSGARIYEPSMMHTKALIVDGKWSVVGSTNFDHRSFGLNHELNLATEDPGIAARLEADFARDLAQSRFISYRSWRRRSLIGRMNEAVGWLLERQQ